MSETDHSQRRAPDEPENGDEDEEKTVEETEAERKLREAGERTTGRRSIVEDAERK